MTAYPALDAFTAALGDPFEVAGDGDVSSVTLASASATGAAAGPGARAPFSLLFVDAAGRLLPQGVYRLHHRELGAMDLFLVPVRHEAGVAHEAVFG